MKSSEPKEKMEIEMPAEGITLSWNEEGLRIEVNDYHIRPINLPWDKIRAIAESVGHKIVSAESLKSQKVVICWYPSRHLPTKPQRELI